ncbi:hypothetical protein VTJ83DRAFT_7407 [Remersonia thermophila]|uniref:Uncharacterized protein n=1 Tax=Remersonia thermophila TaxID=72144 RepID=A0ABR4D3N4_9PEZI
MSQPPSSRLSPSDHSGRSTLGFPSTTSPSRGSRPRGREANVYDAVAGRVTINVALSDSESAQAKTKRRLSATADRYLARNQKLAPEEVLFRRKNAPVRYAEHDIYWANEDLPDGGRHQLPDEALLRAIHGYASRFYDATAARLGPRGVVGSRTVDERSMDETALLAFGILLEEASREAIGKAGDLVFTEAASELKMAAKVAKTTTSRWAAEQPRDIMGRFIRQDVREAKRRRVVDDQTEG